MKRIEGSEFDEEMNQMSAASFNERNEMTGGPLPKAVAQLKNEMKLTCLIELSDERSQCFSFLKHESKGYAAQQKASQEFNKSISTIQLISFILEWKELIDIITVSYPNGLISI